VNLNLEEDVSRVFSAFKTSIGRYSLLSVEQQRGFFERFSKMFNRD